MAEAIRRETAEADVTAAVGEGHVQPAGHRTRLNFGCFVSSMNEPQFARHRVTRS